MPPVIVDVRNAEDTRDVVHQAVQALVEGKLVAFPTETVYGLAARALDEDMVQRLREVKGRKHGHPLPLAIRSAAEARDYAPDLSPLAQRLARRCWPGPVTLVVNDSHPDSLVRQLPKSVRRAVSPHQTIGLRVPGHQVLLDVLQMIAGPLTLTSANRTGQPDPRTAEEVAKELGNDVDLILDDGPSRFGQPSSVVRVHEKRFDILRAGVVPEQALERLSRLMVLFVCTGNTCRSPMAELMMQQLLAKQFDCSPDEVENRGVIVASSGIAAMMGGRATDEAAQAMSEDGLDLAAHETQPLTEPLVQHADFIFTMTNAHRHAILAQWPEAAERTHVLTPDNSDVSDPIGGTIESYRKCATQIRASLEVRIQELEL